MIVREIQFGSPDYQRALQLREQVLRAPLGLSLSAEDLAGEAEQIHFGLFEADALIACLVVRPIRATAKLRQMAVAPDYRGKGCGRQLMRTVEERVLGNYERVELAAREEAVGFYQSLGYGVSGETYYTLGIKHSPMCKQIA